MRAIYFDCFSGASGDMLLGALVGCGVSLDALTAELATLPLAGYRLAQSEVQRAGIAATKVDVLVEPGEQPHRRLADIRALIDGSRLPRQDKDAATRVFERLGAAEAAVHGVGIEDVAFHEVGAVDAIVDVLGTVVGLRLLGVEAVFCSPLPVGSGEVRAAHGRLPVPGPATLALLAQANAPIAARRPGDDFELLTPTAAALLTSLARFEQPALRLERAGYGAGGKDPATRPNVLRAWLGEMSSDAGMAVRTLVLVETTIDDLNPEIYGFLLERLFAAGALDAWYTPVQMKKNRPGLLVTALCPPEVESALVATLLRETSTLGVRARELRRYAAEREIVQVATALGEARVNVKRLPGEPPRAAPEYEDCAALARSSGLPLVEVYLIVARAAEAQLLG
jgi:pyridinium-3,5-bisthiocarboxylic acid mononucleotide nickel chelatase